MIGTSWTHLIARRAVRPLLGTRVRPNHLTTLRLLSGMAACWCFTLGTDAGLWWGGGLWLASAFLDRADGELARIGGMAGRGGHIYDYYSDNLVNVSFFVAIGVGLRHSWLGAWSMPLGLLSGAALLLCSLFSEAIERRGPPDTRAYAGKWGFDLDDGLYLLAPLAWLGWLGPVLVGSAVGCTAIMIVTGIRLLRLRRLASA